MIKYNASGISQNLMYLYADHTYFADETRHSSGLETDEIREYSNSGNNVSFPDAIRVDDLYELTSGHGIYTDGVHSKDGNIQLGDNGVLSSVGSLYFDIDIDNNSGTLLHGFLEIMVQRHVFRSQMMVMLLLNVKQAVHAFH